MTRDLSVVTWDSSFRESLHWFDAMHAQTWAPNSQFIWVDFYAVDARVQERCRERPNFQALSLAQPSHVNWHLGRSMNHGVAASDAPWLLLTDGDIYVDDDFIERVFAEEPRRNEVVYFRRYDELEQPACDAPPNMQTLPSRCVLSNPTNFGACLLIHRSLFEAVGGYEEHETFAGAGIISMELNVRLRNAGAAIRWSSIPTYHPWHANTGAPHDPDLQTRLQSLATRYGWLLPYAGVAQSWVVHCRAIEVDARASQSKCDDYLAALPEELKVENSV
ncbi:MAG: glycosyltransferase [Pseudomonadota bacterium]